MRAGHMGRLLLKPSLVKLCHLNQHGLLGGRAIGVVGVCGGNLGPGSQNIGECWAIEGDKEAVDKFSKGVRSKLGAA